MPVDRKENFGDDMKRMRRLSRPDDGDMTFGGLPAPQITIPYEVTVKDRKDVFHAITVMKVSIKISSIETFMSNFLLPHIAESSNCFISLQITLLII